MKYFAQFLFCLLLTQGTLLADWPVISIKEARLTMLGLLAEASRQSGYEIRIDLKDPKSEAIFYHCDVSLDTILEAARQYFESKNNQTVAYHVEGKLITFSQKSTVSELPPLTKKPMDLEPQTRPVAQTEKLAPLEDPIENHESNLMTPAPQTENVATPPQQDTAPDDAALHSQAKEKKSLNDLKPLQWSKRLLHVITGPNIKNKDVSVPSLSPLREESLHELPTPLPQTQVDSPHQSVKSPEKQNNISTPPTRQGNSSLSTSLGLKLPPIEENVLSPIKYHGKNALIKHEEFEISPRREDSEDGILHLEKFIPIEKDSQTQKAAP